MSFTSFHADHIKPWKLEKRTNLYNLQVLCKECNLRKGAFWMNFDDIKARMRVGQRECFEVFMECLEEQRNYFSGILPTRYGKSDVIRVLALAAKYKGLISGTICVSPYVVLQNQIINEHKLEAMSIRYKIPKKEVKKVRRFTFDDYATPFVNNEYLLSSTIQFLQRHDELGLVDDLVDKLYSDTGKPLLFLVDEAHVFSVENTRGVFFDKYKGDERVRFALLTATPYRYDKKGIPGFVYDKEEINEINFSKCIGVSEETDMVKMAYYEGVECVYKLRADYQGVGFRQCWSDQILCRLERISIGSDFSSDDGDKLEPLSEMKGSRARKCLYKALTSDEVIEEGVNILLKKIKEYRDVKGLRDVAAIVFTVNDRKGQDNYHANKIKKVIEKCQIDYNLRLDCNIATLDEKKSNSKANKIIESFCDEKRPEGDVLIVKQMAGAGLDCPRMKIILDLSAIRSPASCIQRWTRVATPYGKQKEGVVIILNDCISRAIWENFITKEGGDISCRVADVEKVREYEVPRKEKEENNFKLVGSYIEGFEDSDGNIGDITLFFDVLNYKEMFPEYCKDKTDAQISCILKRHEDFFGKAESEKGIGSKKGKGHNNEVGSSFSYEADLQKYKERREEHMKSIFGKVIPRMKVGSKNEKCKNVARILWPLFKKRTGITGPPSKTTDMSKIEKLDKIMLKCLRRFKNPKMVEKFLRDNNIQVKGIE